MQPDEYLPSINHGWAVGQGWTMQDILDATGRTYEKVAYYMPTDENEASDAVQQVGG